MIERADRYRQRFLAELSFTPDQFQLDGFDALDAGANVLVSAPTGSGKTLIATYGVHRAQEEGTKAFYTTPLKALSNQKFHELADAYGEATVGLLTGDNAIRPEAPIVVMTTEVLRNMLLSDSRLLDGLGLVVLDEVHFLQDPYRGGVWEEVLILAPEHIRFICLSATVNNAHELGDWLASVRGGTEVIVERRRPVSLRHLFAIHRREEDDCSLIDLLEAGSANPEGVRLEHASRRGSHNAWRSTRSGRGPRGRDEDAGRPYRTPSRTEIIDALAAQELLPAIYFIFSRVGCEEAARRCARSHLMLPRYIDRPAIRRSAERHVADLSDDDLSALGYDEWLDDLESGFGAHHAGLVPAFRETVEECFANGWLPVVFATETLSLGINMPARSVVIERFTKYGSGGRGPLSSGEYAQLTGRAGRRGLDTKGYSVVCFNHETGFSDVARVATAPPPDLRSAFRPTYNLIANLIDRFTAEQAHLVLDRSFAQWQADRSDSPRKINLSDYMGRRLAVLAELGYVEGWHLTESGQRVGQIYHESDLLIAEAVEHDLFTGAEPAVIAGVLSALIFEERRARRFVKGPVKKTKNKRTPTSWIGAGRRQDLDARLATLVELGERVRVLEELHRLTRTRRVQGGLAGAVCAWARGAPLSAVLEVAAADVGEIAPGDFVRVVKQVADLAGQLQLIALDPTTRAAAGDLSYSLVRDVVASGGPAARAEPTTVAEIRDLLA